MQFIAPALMSESRRTKGIRSLFYKAELQDAFYQARHLERDIFLIWIEGSRLGAIHTFPCILQDGESIFAFESMRDREQRRIQTEMLRRWQEVVTPETIGTQFEVTRMTEIEFDLLYAEYRLKCCEGIETK